MACPAIFHQFTEAQLYTNGSALGRASFYTDFLRGKRSTVATGAIVGTDDGKNYTATRVDFATTKLTPLSN